MLILCTLRKCDLKVSSEMWSESFPNMIHNHSWFNKEFKGGSNVWVFCMFFFALPCLFGIRGDSSFPLPVLPHIVTLWACLWFMVSYHYYFIIIIIIIIIIILQLQSRRLQDFSMHIDLHNSKCGYLICWYIINFMISKHLFDVHDVRGVWTTRLPFAMRWYIKSIFSCRRFLWKTKDVPKETYSLLLLT